MGEDEAINLQAHGDGRSKGGDDERGSHDEPRNNSEVHAAQEVQDEHCGTAKKELGAGGHKGEVRNIKAKLDGEEESIQESRGAKVLDEFHFEPLCSIHKI